MQKTPAQHVKEALLSALISSLIIGLFMFTIASAYDGSSIFAVIMFVLAFFFIFYAFINGPQYQMVKSKKYIEGEIISAIRFLVLEIKSETSLYNAIVNTAKNFPLIGIYFDEIVDKVKMGKTLEQSLMEAVELCPSSHLRNIYWQLLNSLQTGSDITSSLSVLLDDIVEEQKIKISEYGRELNAFSLFYMMIAIIIPTVGFTIVSAILTFIGASLGTGSLLTLWLGLTILQYFFLTMATNRRPAVEAY